jgi:YidC/Oxa1 family membrane protein insertase
MNVWTLWLDALRGLLDLLAAEAGLGLGLAIVVATLLLRTALLPISWRIAYRGCVRQKKLARLQPELQRLKAAHAREPDVYMQKMLALYRKHDLTLIDGRSLFGALAQMPLFLGMFHVLRSAGEGVRFLWVPSLLKADFGLALVAGITTALMILANPDVPEQMRMILLIVPSVIAIVAALNFSSALAVYWTASNCFSAAQTVLLHVVVRRRIRAGTLQI